MSNVLSSLSDDLAGVVESAGKSVVRVEARRQHPASGIVWSDDGLVVTANHVVESDNEIVLGMPDGKTVKASLVGRDPTTDITVLRAEASGLTTPTIDSTDGPRVGNIVLALGRPGQSVLATMGIVSAVGEAWRTGAGGRINSYLQTDVVMYPGFSGGLLVDAGGQVLGLSTSGLTRGASVAIPTQTLSSVAQVLLEHGRIRRGYLGIGAQPVRLSATVAKAIGQETGLLLVSVEPEAPAEQAGLAIGDTIITVDGQAVRHLDELLSALGGDRIGDSIRVQIVRGGETQEVSATVGERPE
jgi:S1-C subfamily serine protease